MQTTIERYTVFISKSQVLAKSQKLKVVAKKYGITASFSGSNTGSLVCKIQKGKIDFISNWAAHVSKNISFMERNNDIVKYHVEHKYIDANVYHLSSNFDGTALQCLNDIIDIMNEDHYDRSDIQTDYFDVSWYNSIKIGSWNKPYVLTA